MTSLCLQPPPSPSQHITTNISPTISTPLPPTTSTELSLHDSYQINIANHNPIALNVQQHFIEVGGSINQHTSWGDAINNHNIHPYKRVFWFVNLADVSRQSTISSLQWDDPMSIVAQLAMAKACLVQSPTLANINVIFIFTHLDQFAAMIKNGFDINKTVPGFHGALYNVATATDWLIEQFLQCAAPTQSPQAFCLNLFDYETVIETILPLLQS